MPAARARSALARAPAHTLASTTRRPLPCVDALRGVAGLAPMHDPAAARALLDRAAAPAMLVGHLPHLSRLTSLLLVGDPAREIVSFRMGAIVCVANEQGRWWVKWILTPELVTL